MMPAKDHTLLIYLDHNATTPTRPEVRAAMAPALDDLWGNPSSVHALGRRARDAVERARQDVGALIGALAEEIIFTSGGTEGDNLAIRGLAHAARAARVGTGAASGSPAHVISSTIEHPAVLGALEELRREGFAVTLLPVDARGEIALETLRQALRPETVLVTLALANHEVGNIFPVRDFAKIAHEHGALFHSDVVQAVGRIAFDAKAADVDAATLSAHKIHGPKGVGAVYVRRGVAMAGLVAGGHQERERRGGTENVAGILGFGAACRLAAAELAETSAVIENLRDRLERQLLALPGARIHGSDSPGGRVPGTTNVGFEGAEGQLVLIGLDLEGVCVSTGAACTSGSLAPSAVLLAMGLPAARAREAVRFSLGRDNTGEEVDRAAALTAAVVARVRAAARG